MPKPMRKDAGSPPNYEKQKLQGIYTQCGGAYGCASILVKAGRLSVSKVRQPLDSEPSYTQFILATPKLKNGDTC